jgi:hypothetical protein
MFFSETTGRPEIQAIHREVQAQATLTLGAIVGRELGGGANEMAAELMRAGLAGLAIWWSAHPDVTRDQIVETALNVLWIGLERVRGGETWSGST